MTIRERVHIRGRCSAGGFTLIELIVVIIILGILAATALPRFANLQTQARIAKLNGAGGAMRGAASLAHAACLASTPQCTTAPGNAGILMMEGQPVSMVNTYPTAEDTGIIRAAGLTVGPQSPDGYNTAGGGGGGGQVITVMVLGNDPPTCSFTYEAPAAANVSPTFTNAVTTGC